MTDRRQLHLAFNILTDGIHAAAWRVPEADPLRAYDPAFWTHIAEVAERGTLDALFMADTLVATGGAVAQGGGPGWAPYDPTIMLTHLAAATERIGLVATISTSFEEPYNVARRVASLDHLSRGRAAFNAITSFDPSVAANFGTSPHLPREQRYARAEEFVDIVVDLWDSWADDALVVDQRSGEFVHPGSVGPIDHVGEHFAVKGPLSLPRSPQGRPVLMQSGGSERGLELAARAAEAVFTSAPSLAAAQEYYADLKGRVVAHGRPADALKILPGLMTIIGSTEAEARQRYEDLEGIVGEGSELWLLLINAGLDPSEVDLDAELPVELLEARRPHWQGSLGFYDSFIKAARTEPGPLRQLVERFNSHRRIIGAPEQVADLMETWFREAGADGFVIMADVNPSGLEDFVDQVVPILRQRGLFRHEYEGTTLREHFGLERPPGRSASLAAAGAGAGGDR